jgi:hypothetical protein
MWVPCGQRFHALGNQLLVFTKARCALPPRVTHCVGVVLECALTAASAADCVRAEDWVRLGWVRV